jgi:hypothetical protein
MSRERRSLRPFETLDRSQRLLREAVRITTHDSQSREAAVGQSLVLTRDEYLDENIDLWLHRNPGDHRSLVDQMVAEAESMYPDDADAVRFVVTLSNSRLKIADKVIDEPLVPGGAISMKWALAERGVDKRHRRPRALQTPGDGCETVVSLLLGRDIPLPRRKPGFAWRKGSWLARVIVRIKCADGMSGPRPLALTPELRVSMGLPPGCLQHVRFRRPSPEDLLTVSSLDEALDFFVDERLLAAVLDDPRSTMSSWLQTTWILDVIRSYLGNTRRAAGFADVDITSDEVSGSLLRAILDKYTHGGDPDELQDALAEIHDDLDRFMSVLQDRAELLTLTWNHFELEDD